MDIEKTSETIYGWPDLIFTQYFVEYNMSYDPSIKNLKRLENVLNKVNIVFELIKTNSKTKQK